MRKGTPRSVFRKQEPGLAGQGVIVTGAGSGIGRATALLFASEGASVFCLDIVRSAASATCDAIRESGGIAHSAAADAANSAAVRRAVSRAFSALGRVDILVSNAGMSSPGSVAQLTPDAWRRSIDVNLTSHYLAAHAVWRHFVDNGGGTLLTVSSVMGIVGGFNAAAYCAAKAAVIMLTRSMAIDGAEFGIRANCVCPGFIDTPMLRGAYRSGGRESPQLRAIRRLQPAGRLGTATDVAQALLYLASPDSAFVSGTTLTVDGAVTAAPLSLAVRATLGRRQRRK